MRHLADAPYEALLLAPRAAPQRSSDARTNRLSSVDGSLHKPRRAPRPVLLADRRRHYCCGRIAATA